MVKYLSEDPSTNDDAKMRAFLSKQIIVDGKTSNGAACIMEPAVKVEDWTAYQTVTIRRSASSSGGFRPIHRGWKST